MSKEKKLVLNKGEGLIPELRFPEFKDDGEWEVKRLCDREIASFVNKKVSLGNLTLETYISTENLLVDFGGVTVSNKLPSSGSFTEFDKDDILISNIRPYLKKIWFADKKGASSNDVLVVRAGSMTSSSFLSFILKNDSFIAYVMKGAKGVKMPRGDRSLMEKYAIPFPKAKEQQKIASCLSSLDEVIASHSQKLDLLKDHKKSLMQNLFPQAGEKVPKYRFTEFENDGEWKETILSEIANYENGKAHEKDIDEKGKYVVVNSKFISTNGEVIKKSDTANCPAKEKDILMVLSDVPNGRAIAKCFFVGKDDFYTVNQRICKIIPIKTDSKFLFYILNRNSYFLAFDDGVKQTNLRNEDVQDFPFLSPKNSKEQRKIASCLSSLDNVIMAQTEKIEQLKLHKKGLLQSLFPQMND